MAAAYSHVLQSHHAAAYWSDKYLLLRLCRQPAAYGVELPFMVHALLPYAAVGHLLFAIWAFGLFGSQPSAVVGEAALGFVKGVIEVSSLGDVPDQILCS